MDNQCRVSVDELNHDREQIELDSMFEGGFLDISCWNCKQTFPNKDMYLVADDVDKGLCNTCSKDDEAREYWCGE